MKLKPADLKTQQEEIEHLNARIKDYQDACAQKQEIINGCTQDIESLTARIKELELFICETFDWDFSTDEEKEKYTELAKKHKYGVWQE